VDVMARVLANALPPVLGQNVFIENKPGAGNTIGSRAAASADPDGYTLMVSAASGLIMSPMIHKNAGYDASSFAAIALVAETPQVLVVNAQTPFKSIADLVAYAKANPGKLNYGSAGNASAGHLAMEYLKLVTGMFITHIPYRGTGPQLTDLLSGRTQASSAGLPALGAHIRAGKLRAIAVGTQQRIAALPDVPTVAELGYKDFETSQWYGILAPAGTPADVVKKLQEESFKALKSSAVTERFATDSAVGGGGSSAEFAAFIAKEQKIWKEIVKQAQIKAD
ncbi:MAG TPA: tripartite tricarboxylate transporter substrate binding protein, partial [Steroidobacteraceae bacterium]|nr:tripartite tricarboxylate transporter substrate binding protein [Steroidobacteraceae bacterium]